MSQTWLSSILYLLTFLRCTLIWLDITLLPFSFLTDIGVFTVTTVAFVFNITVCTLEHRAKQQTQRLKTTADKPLLLPAKIWVICLDFAFAAGYMLLFAMTMAQGGSWDPTNRNDTYVVDGVVNEFPPSFSVIGAQAYAGILVAWHYHLFFASVSLHSWIHGNRDVKGKKTVKKEVRCRTEAESPAPLESVTVSSKM